MELKDKIIQLISKWRAIADNIDDKRFHFSSKWYSAMTEEEKKTFNRLCDEATNHRVFANELEKVLNGN